MLLNILRGGTRFSLRLGTAGWSSTSEATDIIFGSDFVVLVSLVGFSVVENRTRRQSESWRIKRIEIPTGLERNLLLVL